MRQTFETIAPALLCAGKDLHVLDQFINEKYSTSNAIRDAIRYSERLGLERGGVQALRDGQEFYHNYSHPTHLTIAAGAKFAEEGFEGLYVGAAFDERKMDAYVKEIEGRLSLARVFSNFVDAVRVNVAKW